MQYLPVNIPFGRAEDTMLSPPTREYGYMDIFVDDMIGLCVNLPGNVERLSQALAGAVDAFCRPPKEGELPPRDDCLHEGKTFIEGSPKERLVILGWEFCFRTLTVRLPQDKYQSWNKQIELIISAGKICHKELESLIGKLSHASLAVPIGRYYLGRFYTNLKKYHNNKWENRYLKSNDVRYLRLWQRFLQIATAGVSFNKLTCRRPTNLIVTDACPKGMGGLSINSGAAWRIEITHPIATSNNNYEFLATVIDIWYAAINNEINKEGVVLDLTDNSSAVGWLYSCSCDHRLDSFRTEIAHKLASITSKGTTTKQLTR